MPYISPRPISPAEVEVLLAALTRAQILKPHHIDLATLNSITVYSKCQCGCASIGFLPEQEKSPPETHLIADGQGHTVTGEDIGVLVYGTDSRVVDMEVYWYETSGAPLPVASSIGEPI
jgi:hypothetical protein